MESLPGSDRRVGLAKQGQSERPAWLLAESDDSRWFFRKDVSGYADSHYTLNWEINAHNKGLSDRRVAYWRTFAQSAVLGYAEAHSAHNLRSTSILNYARSIRAFAQWACFERMCESISSIAKDDIQAYERHLEEMRISSSAVEQRLTPLRSIWELREAIGETIGIRCYRWRGEIRAVSRRIGIANGRTPTFPPEDYFRLLDHCLGIIHSADAWVDAAERYARVRDASSNSGRVFQREGTSAKKTIEMARLIYGAAAVLVFSLLGPRKHEVANVDLADAKEVLNGGSLGGRVSKSSNGSGGESTRRPVVPELIKAIELVLRLTGVDLNSDEGALFRPILLDRGLQRGTSKPLDTGQIYRMISRVAVSAGIKFKVRPHMFRRAFSMIYVWRYEFGDLAHLSRFLQHKDLVHTVAYAQGDDVRLFMRDAEIELGRSLMERALTGKERFGGGFGALLERVGRRLRGAITVLRPNQVDDWMRSRLDAGQFSISPAPHGYCVVLGDRGGKGACSTNGRTPDLVNRTDEHCAGCSNFLLTHRSVGYWKARYEAHASVLRLSGIEVVRAAASAAVSAARKVLISLGVRLDEQ